METYSDLKRPCACGCGQEGFDAYDADGIYCGKYADGHQWKHFNKTKMDPAYCGERLDPLD